MNMNAHMDSGTSVDEDTLSPFVDAMESMSDDNANGWGQSVECGVRGRENAVDLEGDSVEGNLLTDLPDACIGLIVSRLSPRDVARSACVSRAFRETLESDFLWELFLPVSHAAVMARAANGHRKFATTKATFEFLCRPLLLHPGTQEYWLDKGTGGACYSVAPRGLEIVWVEDSQYWDWITTHGARLPQVANLKAVCWFHVSGELKCVLPPGAYTLSWRLQYVTRRVSGSDGWAAAPTKFHLALSDGSQATNSQRFLTTHSESAVRQNELETLTPVRLVEDNWMEYDAGEILVRDGETETALIFSMIEIVSGGWKSGVNLDGIVLRPTSLSKSTGRTLSVEDLGESSVQSEGPFRIRNGDPRNGPFGVQQARGMFPMRRGGFRVVRGNPVPDDAGENLS